MDDTTPHDVPAQDVAAEDAAVARLRAADPAAGVEPDAVALRSAVDERLSADAQAAVPDELAARRARRWTSWPARIAGVAAAALVVGGGGGYAIGAAGSADQGPTAEAAITLDSASGNSGSGNSGAESAASDVPAIAPRVTDMAASDSAYWPGMWWGRTVFTASGLSDDAGTLHAWALDPTASFTEQTVASMAAALGVAGAPQLTDGVWTVGPNDGTGPSMQLYPDGTASLSYWDPSKDVWYCAETAVVDPGVATGGTEGESKPDAEPVPDADPEAEREADPSAGIDAIAPESCERDLGPAPQGDAAVAQMKDMIAAIGLDPATFEYVAEDTGDASQAWAYVTAYQVIDGQRSGLTWSMTLTGAGVQSLYGSTAPTVDLGEYAVVSPVEAVERLADPRFASFGGPLYMAEGRGVAMDESVSSPVEQPTVPPTVQPGAAISWPVSEATIVEARLGLALHTQMDGAALLVPTYELTSSDGGVWTVIAVADSHLDFSTGQ
jgi:hypothetical protein